MLPKIDDWGDVPDAWDYDQILDDNKVEVVWSDELIDGHGNTSPAEEFAGWSLTWKHGTMFIGAVTNTIALKAAALFVSLWLRGFSASFADKLMDSYIVFLERQEQTQTQTRYTFLAEIGPGGTGWPTCFLLSNVQLKMDRAPLPYHGERIIMDALKPDDSEEIIVTFTKRTKR
jgi:hypothetical protein